MKKIILIFMAVIIYSLPAFSQRYTSADLLKTIRDGSENSVINVIIDSGVNVNAIDRAGNTPLILATQMGYTETVNKLISAGANVDIANGLGLTPLFIASQLGYTAIVEALLKAGANADIRSGSNLIELIGARGSWYGNTTALMIASWKGHTEIVKLLLAAGADVNARVNINLAITITPFFLYTDKKLYLLNGATALLFASWYGHTEIVRLLLEAGVDVNPVITDTALKQNRYTPMSNAASGEIVNMLKAAGASQE